MSLLHQEKFADNKISLQDLHFESTKYTSNHGLDV